MNKKFQITAILFYFDFFFQSALLVSYDAGEFVVFFFNFMSVVRVITFYLFIHI